MLNPLNPKMDIVLSWLRRASASLSMIVMNLARTLKYTDNPLRDCETRGSALPYSIVVLNGLPHRAGFRRRSILRVHSALMAA